MRTDRSPSLPDLVELLPMAEAAALVVDPALADLSAPERRSRVLEELQRAFRLHGQHPRSPLDAEDLYASPPWCPPPGSWARYASVDAWGEITTRPWHIASGRVDRYSNHWRIGTRCGAASRNSGFRLEDREVERRAAVVEVSVDEPESGERCMRCALAAAGAWPPQHHREQAQAVYDSLRGRR